MIVEEEEFKSQIHRNIVLMGDSVFDNYNYTKEHELSIVEWLRALDPKGDRASLVARDGATLGSLPFQLRYLPEDTTHVFVSIGGNDVLGYRSYLSKFSQDSLGLLKILGIGADKFEVDYRLMLDHLLLFIEPDDTPIMFCNIYRGNFQEEQDAINFVLRPFNAVIEAALKEYRLELLDLYALLSEPEDFVNTIEPSHQGGEKLAKEILEWTMIL